MTSTGGPLVSVLIANHDYGRFVGEAIESVQAQTYGEWELIVCDDGSGDDSVEVVRARAEDDPRIRLIEQENKGQGAALSAAANLAQGELLCFLDADDSFLPQKLMEVVTLYRASGAGFLMHRVVAVDAAGLPLQELPLFGRLQGGSLRDEVVKGGGRWQVVPSSGLTIAARLRSMVFPIPTVLRTGADAFVFTLAPLLTEVAVSDEILARYRVHGSNVYAASSPDVISATFAREELELVNREVNRRLEQVGSSIHLDLNRHLMWRQSVVTARLLGGAVEPTIPAGRLAWDIISRDPRPLFVRGAVAFVFALAPFVPRRWRQSWLANAIGFGFLKRLARRFAR